MEDKLQQAISDLKKRYTAAANSRAAALNRRATEVAIQIKAFVVDQINKIQPENDEDRIPDQISFRLDQQQKMIYHLDIALAPNHLDDPVTIKALEMLKEEGITYSEIGNDGELYFSVQLI